LKSINKEKDLVPQFRARFII